MHLHKTFFFFRHCWFSILCLIVWNCMAVYLNESLSPIHCPDCMVVFLIWRLVFSNTGIYYWIISFLIIFRLFPFVFPFLKFQIVRSKTSWIILSHLLIFSVLLSIYVLSFYFLGNSLKSRVEFFCNVFQRLYS